METFLNQIRIQQGEDWTFDKKISSSSTEYIPFIVTKRDNPYFVITVASTKFEKNNRYVESYWLKYTGPMFVQGVPYNLGELSSVPTSYNDLPEVARAHDPLDCLYQYTLAADEEDEELGHKPYYYCYFTEGNQLVTSYECRLAFNLSVTPSNIGTANWGSQNYMYQITLVAGQKMVDTIAEAKDAYPNLSWRPDWPSKNELEKWLVGKEKDIFTFIKQHVPSYFQTDIDWDSPLGRIWAPKSILAPTKLQVDNNLRKII